MMMVSTNDMHERLEAIVFGRVQMVMYRDFTCRMASRYSLSGEVQNLSDGTVRVVAEGTRTNLERLLKRLHKGPIFARVENVIPVWEKAKGEYKKFSITYAR